MPLATFLNGRAPTRLRGAQFLAFTASAAVQRRTATTDIGGGATWTWTTISTVPCRLYPVSTRGRGALIGGALDERSTHFCALPMGTDITSSDRIVVATVIYDVTLVSVRTDQLTRVIEVMQA